MKTPYYVGNFTVAQHTDVQDDDQLRERMLEHRLANRDDVRDIYVVTAAPFVERLGGSAGAVGSDLFDKASKKSKNDLSWAMHWAIQVGDQFFELQRGYPDPMRTGLRVSTWDSEKQNKIVKRYRQGVTAMTDQEIKEVGQSHFARLERIDINLYGVWCNNCQAAVDHMLRDIGGLFYYRSKLESLQEMVRQFFYDSVLRITTLYGHHRGWNEEVITKNAEVLQQTLHLMTSRSKYPKRHWIQQDIDMAEGVSKKVCTIGDHWFLSVLESSLSLRKGAEEMYVRRGADGKPELNFDAVRDATKGIFDENEKDWRKSGLKAMPWLTAGFALGTTRWAAAILSIACQQMSKLHEDEVGLKAGLETSLTGLGVSPKPEVGLPGVSTTSRPRNNRRGTDGPRRIRSKTTSIDNKLVARWERRLTSKGVPYYYDHIHKIWTWDAPEMQEKYLRITDLPLSKKWEEKQKEGHTMYVNRITGDTTDVRPGPSEIWAIKKKIKPDWVKSTVMALPPGWEMRRTEEGERYYLNHNNDPPTATEHHPMRQEIEDERRILLPKWNVEWDDGRGKKYRNIKSGEIRWKAVDGPRYVSTGDRVKINLSNSQDGFNEPLPPGWTLTIGDDGRKIYKNGKTGKDKMERRTHPLTDKRKRLMPEWEMRYTPYNKRYWVHFAPNGQGSTWWARNRLLKNTSLKNNASGWKLAKNGVDWEWFEGGDVPHADLPVLDLDDPAELEYREYPFVLPTQTTTLSGNFIEPLPANWVKRTQDDGSTYYWDFKNELRSDEHPNEEERRNLPALWSMRYTRHGRQYFIHHDDGSTWWTHPREDKHKHNLRARPGQSQDGWKIAEDGKTWERFEEHPDARHTEEVMESLSPKESVDNDAAEDDHSPDTWRSLSFTREWLKSANSNEAIAKVIDHIPQTPKLFRKHKNSPSMDSILERSPQEYVKGKGHGKEESIVDLPMMTDEPRPIEEPKSIEEQQCFEKPASIKESLHQASSPKENIKKTWAQTRDPRALFRQREHSSSFTSNMLKKSQGFVKAEKPSKEEQQTEMDAMGKEPRMSQESSTASLLAKDVKKNWNRRTSNFFGRKKTRSGESNDGRPITEKEDLNSDIERAVDGLGISGAEQVDSGTGIVVVLPTEGEDAKTDVHEETGSEVKDKTSDAGQERVIVGKSDG
ncbi:MAG: hypothetical protein L6R41_000429 [Letrouitia leprolyta]|nr:MAG: hypothetical protein L6R41_000429 [Letrouitia leprolyta]